MTMVIELLIRMHRYVQIVRQMQGNVLRNRNRKDIRNMIQLRQEWNTSSDQFNSRDRLTGTRIQDYMTTPGTCNDGVVRTQSSVPRHHINPPKTGYNTK